MAEAKQITQLKTLAARRNKFMQRVWDLDAQINAILGQIKVKGAAEKQDCPKEGSAPYKLCKVMSSRPKTKEEIAKKTSLSVANGYVLSAQVQLFSVGRQGERVHL